MKIERIEKQGEATTILSIDDPKLADQVLNRVECSKVEWVQWIVSHLTLDDGRHMRLWAVKEDNKIKAYMIAMNAVQPPLSRSIFILYQNFFGMTDEEGEPYHRKLLEKVKQWAKECGARKLCIQTDYPHINSRLDFVEEGHTMVLELK